MTNWGPALARKGLASHYWGPGDRGTYAELSAHWPASNPTLPSEAELLAELEAAAAPTVKDVQDECDRRLAVGFDYDFGDARGIHRIGTTERDMAGWDEVSKIAQALINVGQSTQTITISTDTGNVDVTAAEWQQILIAAGQFRQPIWLASFDLQDEETIPADYKNDSYWTDEG